MVEEVVVEEVDAADDTVDDAGDTDDAPVALDDAGANDRHRPLAEDHVAAFGGDDAAEGGVVGALRELARRVACTASTNVLP